MFLVLPLAAAVAAPATATAAPPLGVYCASGADSPFRAKPRTCAFYARGTNPTMSASQVRLSGLRWKHWGRPVTTTSATIAGNMGYRAKVRVRLSSRETCGSHRIYRRLRVEFRAKGSRPLSVKLPRCDAK